MVVEGVKMSAVAEREEIDDDFLFTISMGLYGDHNFLQRHGMGWRFV